MTRICNRTFWVPAVAIAAASAFGGLHAWPATALTPAGELASHRAVYELKLAQSRKSGSVVSARGRILYDFAGSACEGYTLSFRQVSELDSGEGNIVLSDLRSNSWEDGAAKTYQFNSEDYRNRRLHGSVDGRAERQTGDVAVALTKPASKKFDLEAQIVFPTEHVRRIIDAARAGKTILEFPVYDGSDTGEKVYNTLTVIGREIAPNERVPTDAAAGNEALATLKRWPVTVSYFERGGKTGEQLPVYAITFELYENGISRSLLLDYNEITISGELTSLDIKESKPCP